MATLPATFMTVVCSSYILLAPEGLRWPAHLAIPVGLGWLLFRFRRARYGQKPSDGISA
jgi:hypothetical protein